MNNTDIATLTMAEPGDRNAHKLATGEIIDIYGGTWDGPEAWTGMKIAKADSAPNFVEYFPVWRYSEGLDYPLCALYSMNRFLPGGVGIPLSSVRTYEWRNRVLSRTKYLYQSSDYDREIAARSSYTQAIIQRSRRFGSFEVTGDPGFGNAA
eukprot:IDg19047t1